MVQSKLIQNRHALLAVDGPGDLNLIVSFVIRELDYLDDLFSHYWPSLISFGYCYWAVDTCPTNFL